MKLSLFISFFILALFSVSKTVIAQQESSDTLSGNQFVMNFHAGTESQKFNNLNTVLSDNGFVSLDQISFSAGGGYYRISDKSNIVHILDFSVATQSVSEQSNTTKIKGMETSYRAGYAVVKEDKIQVIPYIGLAYTWLNVKMLTKVPNNTITSSFLSGTANQFEMTANYYLTDFGGQATFSPVIDKKTGERLIIGIRSGYAIPVSGTNWNTDNTTLKDGPEMDDGKFHVNLIIGITL